MNGKPKTVDQLTPYDFIMLELRGIREEMRNMRQEIRDVRQEVKDVRTELNGRMDKLEYKIEDVRKETKSAMRHSQIMTGSCVAIALGVLYAIFFK